MLIDCKSIAVLRLDCDHSLNAKVAVRRSATASLFCVREEQAGETAGLPSITVTFYCNTLQYTCNNEKKNSITINGVPWRGQLDRKCESRTDIGGNEEAKCCCSHFLLLSPTRLLQSKGLVSPDGQTAAKANGEIRAGAISPRINFSRDVAPGSEPGAAQTHLIQFPGQTPDCGAVATHGELLTVFLMEVEGLSNWRVWQGATLPDEFAQDTSRLRLRLVKHLMSVRHIK